ncbi:hypothetical protein [Nocardioides terrigena]|uniref:hypothetical protein n=1 Tax=Nocardioides terrigena TaxID=424797 RepID=UPI000D320EF1|nr:hypothetical protein [Nocardioides terrigena]
MAQHRHKRDANARRTMPSAIQVAGPVAVLATLSAVAVGVMTSNPSIPGTDDLLASSSSAAAGISASSVAPRGDVVSRSERRQDARAEAAEARQKARQEARQRAEREARQEQQATLRAVRSADTRLWTTTELNLWTSADGDARNVGLVEGLEKVLVTGRKDGDRVEVVVGGKSRWVTAGYLADEKPETGPALGGQCTNGSAIDAGSPSLYEIHDVVCANWPEITSYGTWRSDGEHGEGRAIDIMVSGETGWAIAEFLRANYSSLGIEYIIYSQKMWSVERSGEGWRYMSDRGSTTANHYDHVHVTVY